MNLQWLKIVLKIYVHQLLLDDKPVYDELELKTFVDIFTWLKRIQEKCHIIGLPNFSKRLFVIWVKELSGTQKANKRLMKTFLVHCTFR